ncbi:MAG TPA: alpha-amylase family glycosyl hydrolase, partial [Cyclobacteriaceae bacterium]
TRNWGYDGVFPFAVQNSYGGPASLQHLINTCHQHGLAVILDVVYNHFGPEGNNAEKFGSYLTEKYKTPWGGAVNFDDAECDAVREYFIENVLMWFRDFHVDALRLDAVHAIKDFSPVHILKEIRQYVDTLMSLTGRLHYLIVECDLNDTRFIEKTEEGGYGMHAQWIDEFHHALRVTSGQEPTGYYSDFNGINHLAKSFKDAYVYDGIYSCHRKKTFGTKTDNIPDDKFIVFSQNHDQVGNRMLGERSSILISFDLQKVLAASVLMSPYLPLLFMGEEYGERNPFLYFTDFSSEELIESVRKGRKKEFADFHIDGEMPDPQAITSFEKSKLNWNLLNKRKHFILLGYYNQLIKYRKSRANIDRRTVVIKAFEDQKVLMLRLTFRKFAEVYFFNFSHKEQIKEIEFTKNKYEVIFNSDDAKWLGSAAAIQRSKPQQVIIPPESFLVLRFSNV